MTSLQVILKMLPEVKVFVDVHVEEWVKINKVLVGVALQSFPDDGTVKPLV